MSGISRKAKPNRANLKRRINTAFELLQDAHRINDERLDKDMISADLATAIRATARVWRRLR